MVEYLRSPMWTTEICDYVDENCIFFGDEEENSFEHTDIHNKFKELVDTKLMIFCAELGITEEIFTKACSKIS